MAIYQNAATMPSLAVVGQQTASVGNLAEASTLAIISSNQIIYTEASSSLITAITVSSIAMDSGQFLTWVVTNTSPASKTITFPASLKWKNAVPANIVLAGTTNIYTFINVNGFIYATAIDTMS